MKSSAVGTADLYQVHRLVRVAAKIIRLVRQKAPYFAREDAVASAHVQVHIYPSLCGPDAGDSNGSVKAGCERCGFR